MIAPPQGERQARASKLGVRLAKLSDELRVLFNDINFGPELSAKDAKAFTQLGHIKQLVEVALELYPYDYE